MVGFVLANCVGGYVIVLIRTIIPQPLLLIYIHRSYQSQSVIYVNWASLKTNSQVQSLDAFVRSLLVCTSCAVLCSLNGSNMTIYMGFLGCKHYILICRIYIYRYVSHRFNSVRDKTNSE